MVEDSPVEIRNGIFYKREDLFEEPIFGVNGSKWRTWSTMIGQLDRNKYDHVVVAGSVHAPTVPITAVAAAQAGLKCTVIVGGTTPEKAVRHHYIDIARQVGADIQAIGVGYNPALQKAAREFEQEHPRCWRLAAPDITSPHDAVDAFLEAGSTQTANLPNEIETLVVPFGSGITASGILYGLHKSRPTMLKNVVLMGIGPDKRPWLDGIFDRIGMNVVPKDVELVHKALYPDFAKYNDRMKETLDGIEFHPTYEGKAIRWLEDSTYDNRWWEKRDATVCFWIVGGEF